MEKLLAAITALSGMINRVFDGVAALWKSIFFKPKEQKIEEAQKKVSDEIDEFHKTGRPPK
jgi:hypothetical protein